jgi:pilus assembly protein Flp/PilA
MIQALLNLHQEESGQDLIEYALVVALIALAAVVGMQKLANGINSAFTALSSILGKYIS